MANDGMSNMSKAKGKLFVQHVFYASLILQTPLVIDNTIPTAATDMKKIYYNEKFINSLTVDVVMFVIVHEVMHIMFKHGLRRNNREHEKWNIACDHAINLILKKGGFSVWPNAYCDAKYEGMSAEQIYIALDEEEKKKNGGKATCNGGFGAGDLVEAPGGMTPEDVAEVERGIQQKVATAFAQAKMQGQMPAGLNAIVEGIINPPAPWQQLLREHMTRVVHNDESWSRRNRRFRTFVLPTKHRLGRGEVVIIGDTSGSMEGYFAQIGAEISEVVEQTSPERTRVIWADDTDCALEEIFEMGEPIELHPKGLGGTDMRKPLKFVERYDPEIVLLITDGYTPWPSEVPYNLIIACSTNVTVPEKLGAVIRLR